MSHENGLTPAERELERALASVAPVAASGLRDGLMFRAGQASARRQARIWQGATACLSVILAASLSVQWLAPQPPRQMIVDATARPDERSTDTAGALAEGTGAPPASYLATREQVLAHGVESLRDSVAAGSGSERTPALERPFHLPVQRKRGFFGLDKWIDLGDRS